LPPTPISAILNLMPKRKTYPLIKSFSFAFKGIFRALKRERNIKIHISLASLAVLLGIILNINAFEWIIIILLISLVIAAEIFNSAIEAISDLLRFKLDLAYLETYWIRNFAAGAVIMLALGAFIIGMIIFLPKIFS
jgi:undecaprenol kinase